jgi:hypothetical protein
MFVVDVCLNSIIRVGLYSEPQGNGAPSMFTSYYYLKLKGKHCQKPHCHNRVVDHLGLGLSGGGHTGPPKFCLFKNKGQNIRL